MNLAPLAICKGLSRPAAYGNALDAGDVFPRSNVGKTRVSQQAAHGGGLVVAVFQEKPAAVFEVVACAHDDGGEGA